MMKSLYKSNEKVCVVCQGLVARGIDTKNIDFVLNYDFPSDVKQFIHRCGRTGRNGQLGEGVFSCEFFMCSVVFCYTIRSDFV